MFESKYPTNEALPGKAVTVFTDNFKFPVLSSGANLIFIAKILYINLIL